MNDGFVGLDLTIKYRDSWRWFPRFMDGELQVISAATGLPDRNHVLFFEASTFENRVRSWGFNEFFWRNKIHVPNYQAVIASVDMFSGWWTIGESHGKPWKAHSEWPRADDTLGWTPLKTKHPHWGRIPKVMTNKDRKTKVDKKLLSYYQLLSTGYTLPHLCPIQAKKNKKSPFLDSSSKPTVCWNAMAFHSDTIYDTFGVIAHKASRLLSHRSAWRGKLW